MEQAAAMLVQAIFDSNRMQELLKEASDPQTAAELLKPWFEAMLVMVRSADSFDRGRTTQK